MINEDNDDDDDDDDDVENKADKDGRWEVV